MTTNNTFNVNTISSKEFNALSSEASRKVGAIQKSYFQLINTLNKLAKHKAVTYNDMEEAETISTEALFKVAKELKKMHQYDEPFARCLLNRDSLGRYCGRAYNVGFTGNKEDLCTSYTADVYEETARGAYCYDSEAETYMRPLTPTLQAVYNEFARIAKGVIRTNEKAAKEAERAEKKAAKEAEREARKAQKNKEAKRLFLVKRYNNGEINIEELQAELAKIA